MTGMPAGIEMSSDDDSEGGYYEPQLSSYVQPDNAPSKPSIFSMQNQMNTQEMDERVSMRSEDMRLAILKEDIVHVRNTLDKGYNTETLMQSGWTALMYASNNASCEIVELLLERKASANFQKDLFTPLMAVCYSSVRNEDKLVTCAKLLIDADAKVNVHDRHVMTPLMYSARLGYMRLVTLLCDHHAELDRQDTEGWSALTFAAANGFSNVVRVLLKYGADYNLTTFDGQKPADIAFSHGFTMLADMLEKYDGDNLEQFPTAPNTAPSKTSSLSTKYVKYGDLELFLYGLELGHLIPLMQEHHLQFSDLLKLNETEMIEVGITQLGVRKKLIESIRDIHTNEWDMSSLSKEQITKVTTLETAAIVANITKHLQLINCSVSYVSKHLSNKKEDLVSDNVILQKTIVDQCIEAFQVTKALQCDVLMLRNDAVAMFPNVNKKAADLIGPSKQQQPSYVNRLLFPFGLLVAVSGSLFVSYRMYYTVR